MVNYFFGGVRFEATFTYPKSSHSSSFVCPTPPKKQTKSHPKSHTKHLPTSARKKHCESAKMFLLSGDEQQIFPASRNRDDPQFVPFMWTMGTSKFSFRSVFRFLGSMAGGVGCVDD